MAATDEAIMNQIKHEELFGNLKNFLKGRGIELQEGSYTKRVQQGCEVLADSINMSQRAFKRAKTAVDNGLDQLRQTIHEKTAPNRRRAKRLRPGRHRRSRRGLPARRKRLPAKPGRPEPGRGNEGRRKAVQAGQSLAIWP